MIAGNGTLGHIVNNPDAYFRTILDVELLSRCDELIISGGSTFGFVAAMKRKKDPYFVNGNKNMSECLRHELAKPSVTNLNYAVFR